MGNPDIDGISKPKPDVLDTPHSQLLSDLTLRDGLTFEAAWNWCELQGMVEMAAAACRQGSTAGASGMTAARVLQLDVEQVESYPEAAAQAMATFLREGAYCCQPKVGI